MKKIFYFFVFLPIIGFSQTNNFPVLKGPYLGQKPPGMVPVLFAPGIISTTNKNEFCASFSPDGKEFYFNRGMKIMVCTLKDGMWSSPVEASFSAGFPAHEAHITFDNKKNLLGLVQGRCIWDILL